ncbi:MAG: hypothetical protein JNM53_01495 [Gemmatimonadetes bacterium]|nr:hypothetical protein [Gemmatimonadota bacterium]
MRWGLGAVLLGLAAPLAGQEPRGLEAGVAGLVTTGRQGFTGGGATLAARPGGGARIQVLLAAGDLSGRAVGRGELVAHLLLTPAGRGGIGLYGLAGVAGTTGRRARGDLVLGLGVETRPHGNWGVAVEAGVGGGARFLVGVRRRWLRPPAAR